MRIDGEDLGKGGAQFGTIGLVYPQIEDGRVMADASVADLGDYFVGQRIRVWIRPGTAPASSCQAHSSSPASASITPAFARTPIPSLTCRCSAAGNLPRPDMPDALEILSGLKPGDVLVRP